METKDNVKYVGLWNQTTFRGRFRAAIKALRGRPVGVVLISIGEFQNLKITGPLVFGVENGDGTVISEKITWTEKPPVWVESSDGNWWRFRPNISN